MIAFLAAATLASQILGAALIPYQGYSLIVDYGPILHGHPSANPIAEAQTSLGRGGRRP